MCMHVCGSGRESKGLRACDLLACCALRVSLKQLLLPLSITQHSCITTPSPLLQKQSQAWAQPASAPPTCAPTAPRSRPAVPSCSASAAHSTWTTTQGASPPPRASCAACGKRQQRAICPSCCRSPYSQQAAAAQPRAAAAGGMGDMTPTWAVGGTLSRITMRAVACAAMGGLGALGARVVVARARREEAQEGRARRRPTQIATGASRYAPLSPAIR